MNGGWQEIERKLADGVEIAWDTTDVPDDLQDAVKNAADTEVEKFFERVELDRSGSASAD